MAHCCALVPASKSAPPQLAYLGRHLNVRRYIRLAAFATSGESFWVADLIGDLGTTSDFRFFVPRGERARISRPSKAFWPFWGIFPGKSWGKHLLQRPPTGFKFRQLRLFPYHLKSLGSNTVPVRVRSAAPKRKSCRASDGIFALYDSFFSFQSSVFITKATGFSK